MDVTAAREELLRQTDAQEDHDVGRGICLEKLINEHYERIRALAWKFGLPADEIDDAAQEVFARACAGAKKFRGDCAPSTWLTRIAVNYLCSRRRTMLHHMKVVTNENVSIEQVPTRARNDAESAEARDRAVECISRLPRKLRAAFVLRYLEEMSCAEVAETLGIPEATVRTRIYHARKKLRRMMRGYEP